MKWLDRHLRDLRIRQALPFIRGGDRLLDIGCFDLTLLRLVQERVRLAVGIDPLATPMQDGRLRLIRGVVGGTKGHRFDAESFDCITMLAVLEHVPDPDGLAAECFRLLAPGGRLVITVPDAKVDRILSVLHRLRLIHGMSLEEHHGYDAARTGPVFERAGFTVLRRSTFELGLNNLFVFQRPARPAAAVPPISAAARGRVGAFASTT